MTPVKDVPCLYTVGTRKSVKDGKTAWTSDLEVGAIAIAFTVAIVTWLVNNGYYIFSTCIGIAIIIYSAYSYYRLQVIERWVLTPAKIKKCHTKKYLYSSQSLWFIYSFECLYEYKVDGVTYKSNRVTWKRRDSMTQDIEKHNRLLRKLKNKPERSVYIDPKDYSRSVLLKTNTLSQIIYFLSAFSAAILVMIILVKKLLIG